MLLGWLTFASATIAAVLQGRRAVQGWVYDRLDRMEVKRVTRAGWSAAGVNTWRVEVADEPQTDSDGRPVTVTIAVLSNKGEPSPDQADRMRRYLEEHDSLSRNPTPSELEILEKATDESRAMAFKRARRIRALNWGGRPPGAPEL